MACSPGVCRSSPLSFCGKFLISTRSRRPRAAAQPSPCTGEESVKQSLRIGLLSCVALAVWFTANAAPAPQKAGEVTLKLTVPESGEYPGRGGYKLLIDGKDFSEPKETKRTIKVPLKEGQDKFTV